MGPLLDWVSEDEVGYMGVESLALDPNDSNAVYLLAGTSYFNGGKTAILRSRDRGATFALTDVTAQFKAHGNGMGRQNGERLAVDPNNGSILFCGSRQSGLFKSTDSGASWRRVDSLDVTTTPNGNGINVVVFDPATPARTLGNATQTIIVGVQPRRMPISFAATTVAKPSRHCRRSNGADAATRGVDAEAHAPDDLRQRRRAARRGTASR